MHSILMLLLLGATPTPPVAANSPTPVPTPKISISRATPAERYRTVSPEEIKAALERIQGGGAQSQPVTPTPLARREKIPVIELQLKPKGEIPIMQAVEKIGVKKTGIPEWNPVWESKKQFISKDTTLKLDYQWKGIVAAVELKPQIPNAKIIRILLNKSSDENLSVIPESDYTVTIQGRLAQDTVWIPLYTFENVKFKAGHAHIVAFPASVVAELKEYMAAKNKERLEIVATPKPVEVNATPAAGVR